MPLEEQEPLDVERPLIVEQPGRAADDHLRHDDVDHGVGIGGQLTDVRPERRADVAIGRVAQVQAAA